MQGSKYKKVTLLPFAEIETEWKIHPLKTYTHCRDSNTPIIVTTLLCEFGGDTASILPRQV